MSQENATTATASSVIAAQVIEIPETYFPKAVLKASKGKVPGDFTFYLRNDFSEANPRDPVFASLTPQGEIKEGQLPASYAGKLTVKVGAIEVTGRALACLADGGKFWSFTIRTESQTNGALTSPSETSTEDLNNTTGYRPEKRKPSSGKPSQTDPYLNSIEELCGVLAKQIFPKNSETDGTGLLVVTGSTGAAKSRIARGLIFERLQFLNTEAQIIRNKGRRPHLVTFEDPIEKTLIEGEATTGGKVTDAVHIAPHKWDIDYTPREKGRDVAHLKDALRDALRQTPAIFYVGETRDEDDWADLIKFAGTGHLIVTTAHAGSLVEAMQAIFRATKTRTPAHRSYVANKILALVHLRSDAVENFNIATPALWRRRPAGVNDLIADGLASLLPSESKSVNDDCSFLGRAWFATQLANQAINEAKGVSDTGTEGKVEKATQEIIRQAKKWDLKGE